MGWDEDKKWPVLQDGMDLHATLQALDLKWCLTNIDTMAALTMAIDMDKIMMQSFHMTQTTTLPTW